MPRTTDLIGDATGDVGRLACGQFGNEVFESAMRFPLLL